MTKIIDTLRQEDFHGAFQKMMERYNKSIAVEWDYFEGDYSFMCVLSIRKVAIRKKSGNLFNDPLIIDLHEFLHNNIVNKCEESYTENKQLLIKI